ncbi:hypothetical protein RhiirA1_465177 [Rhizophagus irregularis]|uniref:F-box domain-containing protein n=1 Tax=Rhizophagus irregularis TaxID=588596 RepID=A0A2N0RGG2_9GLOM|nr:hypothetical protein RhiirA1_465177 [Rhizophagus irregularis]
MACQLPVDCLEEIIEFLETDKFTLYTCLLVNRLWCKISVRILWRNTFDFIYHEKSSNIYPSILSTLIACLPDESKNLLYNNGISISPPTSKPLLFNYASFFKTLSIFGISRMIASVLKDKLSLISKDKNSLVVNEIIKMFANQIPSLKKLNYYHHYYYNNHKFNISFPQFPGMSDLSELCCKSDLPSDFFYQLTQICHNLQSISVDFSSSIKDELKELISSQNNLKNFNLSAFNGGSWNDIIPVITEHSHTITKLKFRSDDDSSFSFISSFSNLQELLFSFLDGVLEDFRRLQYVNFPKLQILKIPYKCPKPEYVIKFLENNGKNLKKFYTSENDKDLSLSIAQFCPNLKSLFIVFNDGELDILKTILINCQYLESIKIRCGKDCLSEKEVLETVARYSPNNFRELKIHHHITCSDASPNDLESFFMCWERRTPKKLLSFIIIGELPFTIIGNMEYHLYCGYNSFEALKVIEKYENLGTIKFVTKSEGEVDEEEEYF